jgi:hypothetical protein
MATVWGMTPKESILLESNRRGRMDCVRDCIAVLEGRSVDGDFLRVLAGPSAEPVLDGQYGGVEGYWPRVWAARGLLHLWDDLATDAIIGAMTHDAWRVREMCAKVIARNHVVRAIDDVVRLLDDDVVRVRTAARRAFDAIAE